MKNFMSTYSRLLGLIVLIGMSCHAPEDIEVERDTVDLAFPVFTSETTLSDLIAMGKDSSALVVFQDNSMGLVYESTQSLDMPLPAMQDFGSDLFEGENALPALPVAGVQMTRARLESGRLHLYFENGTYTSNVTVALLIPKLTQNGEALEREYELQYEGSLPVKMEADVDLSDYEINVAHGDMKVNFTAILPDNSIATLNAAHLEMRDVVFDFVEGDWQTKSVALSIPKTNIGFFEHYASNGTVTFSNPKLRLIAQNTSGIPAKVNFNSINAKTINGSTLPLTGHWLDFGFGIGAAQVSGQHFTSSSLLDKSNSNVVEVLAALPEELSYDTDVTLCPQGTTTGFVGKGESIDFKVRAELPFEGKVSDFKVEKSFDVKFTNEHVKAASLKLQAHNEIPLSAKIQLYFLDNTDQVLDSLVASGEVMAIDAAEVGADGEVISATDWENEIPISQARWERIKPAVKVVLVTSFDSSVDGAIPVKIKDNQRVELNAGMKLIVLP